MQFSKRNIRPVGIRLVGRSVSIYCGGEGKMIVCGIIFRRAFQIVTKQDAASQPEKVWSKTIPKVIFGNVELFSITIPTCADNNVNSISDGTPYGPF